MGLLVIRADGVRVGVLNEGRGSPGMVLIKCFDEGVETVVVVDCASCALVVFVARNAASARGVRDAHRASDRTWSWLHGLP